MPNHRRVAVTGVGLVTPLGTEGRRVLTALLNGENGIRPITRFDASAFDVRFGGEIPDFNAEAWVGKREANRVDRFAQFALAAADQAVKDSGLEFSREDPTRAGVIVGSGIGGMAELEEQHERLLHKGPSRVSPFLIPKLMVNAASGHISIRYGLQGPNSAIATACASGAHAIGDAGRTIERGGADLMVCGGAEAALTPVGLAGFASLKALSTRNDAPDRASRPFDRDRDGFVIAEGAGIVVLEEMERARRRGARIYGELRGYGLSGDGCHITQPDPNGKGAAQAMAGALADGELSPADVSYLNAHGTSTPLNDLIETRAIKRVFGEAARKVPISSTKSMLGHSLGASGAIEFAVCCLMMEAGKIHPTRNLAEPGEECDLDYVPGAARELPLKAILSNSFGFGGHNASLLLASL